MTVKIVGSGSSGNCYILENDKEALIIELGVRFEEVKKAVKYNLQKIVGCIVTHEHGDHAKYMAAAASSGLNVYATHGTIEAVGIKSHRLISIDEMKRFELGNFKILPFSVKHDAAQPVGFIIKHDETGNVLFITDTWYVPHRFENIHNIMIEANYCTDIINEKLKTNKKFLRDRVIQSHMSIDTCIGLLKANDISKVNNIILIHLSDSNSNEVEFKEKVTAATGKNVLVACNGMNIPLNKQPF